MLALPSVGHTSGLGEDEKEAVRVFYVAATRATQRLGIGDGRWQEMKSPFGNKLNRRYLRRKFFSQVHPLSTIVVSCSISVLFKYVKVL